MTSRRALASLTLLLLTVASAFAQFTADQKRAVLDEMQDILTEKAFVPGVDLTQWPVFIKEHQDALAEADSPEQFARIVNDALQEFGISHIRLQRRGYGGGRRPEAQVAQAGGSRMSTSELEWLDPDTALIKIRSFNYGYSRLAVEDLFQEAKDAKYIVLDLRSNGGGRVDYMQHLLGLLLPDGTPVGTFVTRRDALAFADSGRGSAKDAVAIAKWSGEKLRAHTGRIQPYKGHLAVLVNKMSASASEIVTNALRENRETTVLGTPTAGAVLVSTYERLSYGFSLQYPVSDYVSIKGSRLEGHPLMPDVELDPADVRTQKIVDEALAALKRKGVATQGS